MSLSNPRINFSIHSVSPYARVTKTIGDNTFYKGLPFGRFQVLGDATMSLNASSVQLYGGSSLYPWASELSQIDSEFTMNVKESPDMLYSIYGGATVVQTAASATGTTGTIVNANGTSAVAATGILSATTKAASETDLKFNYYVVKAVGATTFDVYGMTDLQYANGTVLTDQDDLLKITASPLTLVQDTAVEVPGTGVEITGGAGVIALVTNDTAIYKTVAAHGGISDVTFGQKGASFPEHGLVLYGKERSDGTLFAIEIFKAQVSSGLVIPMTEGDFQITDLTVKALQDNAPIDGSGVSKVFSIRAITPPWG